MCFSLVQDMQQYCSRVHQLNALKQFNLTITGLGQFRKKQALLKSGNNPVQTKITMYYDLLSAVTSFIEKNPNIIQECDQPKSLILHCKT